MGRTKLTPEMYWYLLRVIRKLPGAYGAVLRFGVAAVVIKDKGDLTKV